MEPESNRTPLIAIVGETASGKSALALKLAGRFNGEIIAADSRTIYRGMDIGTAKPSLEDQAKVRHHLLDITTPDKQITAAQFQRLANEAIWDITSRGKIPFLVGGTGLYIDAVLYDFAFAPKGDEAERKKWQRYSIDELQVELLHRGIPLPVNEKNPRHLIRQLETGGIKAGRSPLREDTLLIGKCIEREELRAKVSQRVDAMIERGFVDEVKALVQRFSWSAPGLQAPGYKAFREYVDNQTDLEAAKQRFVHNDIQLAKRQRTWFRRNKSIHWIWKEEEAVDLITTFLNK